MPAFVSTCHFQVVLVCTYPGGRQGEQVDAISKDLAGSVISDSASKGEGVPHDDCVVVQHLMYIDACLMYR
jgi:hypothetical protein